MFNLQKILLTHMLFKRTKIIYSKRMSCRFTSLPIINIINDDLTLKHTNNKKCLNLKERQLTFLLASSLHTSYAASKEIGYNEFKNLQKNGVTVIDVREIDEIKKTGTIPGSLNIPFKQVDYALAKSADDFKSKYGRRKPGEEDSVLFLCQRGARSRKAMEKAVQLGYIKALSLKGGWEDYAKHAKN